MLANPSISRSLRVLLISLAVFGLALSVVWLASVQAQRAVVGIFSQQRLDVLKSEQSRVPALERRASLVYLPTETRAAEAGIYFRLGQLKRARAVIEQVVADQPNSAEAWFLLSIIVARSDPEASALAVSRARALDPQEFGRPR